MGGRMTLALVDWIMCWLLGATSTCWCWIQRSIPIQEGKPQNPRHEPVAKFAARGKALPKKDLGMLAMAYGSVYVAHVAMGANDQQTLRAFLEAEAYDGPSLIIAYSHCIAHGIDMKKGLD